MKFLKEYRDAELVQQYIDELHRIAKHPWVLMEVCGGQTHSLVRNGILNLLPENVTMVHGPGCPVCVTPLAIIDKAIAIANMSDTILCSYGDMLRVPGSGKSLLEAKADGADIRILYSPLEAVQIAAEHPGKEVVFFAVGFETTAPANALSVLHAKRLGLKNYSLLTSHVLVPPAIEALASDPENVVQGFLGAGHVCTIMGLDEYEPLVEKFCLPIVVTGFEPVDLLQGILMLVHQLERGEARLENQYSRVVRDEGNPEAIRVIKEVFEVTNREWRGIGTIPNSGYEVKKMLSDFDANRKFGLPIYQSDEQCGCIAGEILKGRKKPFDCSLYGKECTPTRPIGAPMVSSEGACAAYYNFHHLPDLQK